MVRRVLIAYIGRSACTMATHLHHQQMQQALAERHVEAALGSKDEVNAKESCTHIEPCCQKMDVSDLPHMRLPFLQCEGIVIKQMLPRTDKVAGICCHDCGGDCEALCVEEFMVNDNDVALRRCQEQLLALHCAEALSADLKCTAYPICNTVTKSSLSIGQTKTCNAKIGSGCPSGTVGGFSIGMLHLVNSQLVPDFEIWLANKGAECQEKFQFEDISKTVEDFFLKRDQLLELQRSMLKAVAAQKQASKDGKAVMPRQSLHSTVCMLEQIFADRVQERKDKFTRAAEPFLALLNQINLFLEFFFTRALGASFFQYSTSLCTATSEPSLKTGDMLPDCSYSVEDVQMAVASWLLLYHDVAHATGVI